MSAKRILVVDDEATVLESVRMTLSHFGYEVDVATGGMEALAKLEGCPFALVVTDRKMPGMSGEQLAVVIKRNCPKLPVILLTGFPPETKPPCVDEILLKPFSMAELQAAILSLMENGLRP